jgi:hypothetical protein
MYGNSALAAEQFSDRADDCFSAVGLKLGRAFKLAVGGLVLADDKDRLPVLHIGERGEMLQGFARNVLLESIDRRDGIVDDSIVPQAPAHELDVGMGVVGRTGPDAPDEVRCGEPTPLLHQVSMSSGVESGWADVSASAIACRGGDRIIFELRISWALVSSIVSVELLG